MKKILVIEDNEEVRENTAEILELSNYMVFTAENGKEGVEIAREEKPDLIVCDIMMPVLDGYGVLHLLSKDPGTAGIPFIFLTAKSEMSDFRKGMESGADDYLTKPFQGAELLQAVKVRLDKAAQLKKMYTVTSEEVATLIGNATQSGQRPQKGKSAGIKRNTCSMMPATAPVMFISWLREPSNVTRPTRKVNR